MPEYAGFVGKRRGGLPLGSAAGWPSTLTIPGPNTPNRTKPDKTGQPLKNTGSYSCETRLFPTVPNTFCKMGGDGEGETALDLPPIVGGNPTNGGPDPAHLCNSLCA